MKLINTKNIVYGAFITILAAVIVLPVMTFAGTMQLPKTGQTTCWDTNGILKDCARTGQPVIGLDSTCAFFIDRGNV